MTTPEQLAEQLGLEDFNIFALKTRWRLADARFGCDGVTLLDEVSHRQQGRSTRNILALLCHLTDTGEDVLLVAHNRDVGSLLVKKARDWAVQLGLDPRRIKGVAGRSRAEASWRARQVFVDHAVREFPHLA